MSSDLLRKAAALMRERAEAAPIPNDEMATGDEEWWTYFVEPADTVYTERLAIEGFLSGWRPAVALAVADWLDSVHADLSTYNATTTRAKHAFAVARAYLGGDA